MFICHSYSKLINVNFPIINIAKLDAMLDASVDFKIIHGGVELNFNGEKTYNLGFLFALSHVCDVGSLNLRLKENFRECDHRRNERGMSDLISRSTE